MIKRRHDRLRDSDRLFVHRLGQFPRKPNRWLALPRAHIHALADMTPEARVTLWNATIEKAKSLWGSGWGLAMNSDERRTQCHTHIHIGKLLDGVENPTFEEVDGPAGIPVPKDGAGFWIHPVGDKLHVHSAPEAVAKAIRDRLV